MWDNQKNPTTTSISKFQTYNEGKASTQHEETTVHIPWVFHLKYFKHAKKYGFEDVTFTYRRKEKFTSYTGKEIDPIILENMKMTNLI